MSEESPTRIYQFPTKKFLVAQVLFVGILSAALAVSVATAVVLAPFLSTAAFAVAMLIVVWSGYHVSKVTFFKVEHWLEEKMEGHNDR